MSFPRQLTNLTTREAIADTIYRAVAAYDEADFSLMQSAAYEDAIFEFAGTTMHGLSEVKAENFDHVGLNMDTMHFVTNLRIDVAGDTATKATAYANALAQHYPLGQGLDAENKRLLGGTKYVVDLARDGEKGEWKVTKWRLTIVWAEGDRSVLTPARVGSQMFGEQ